jgi:hypothetical protein
MTAPRFDVRGSGDAFAVVLDGRPIGRVYWKEERAWAAADRYAKAARSRIRRCLCCTKAFVSEGPHNRLCDPCRAST